MYFYAGQSKNPKKGLLTRNPVETTKQVKSKKKMGEAGRGSAGAPVARCPATQHFYSRYPLFKGSRTISAKEKAPQAVAKPGLAC